jgi:hypothetical protein
MHKYRIEDVTQEMLLYLYDNRGDLVDTFQFSAVYLRTNDYTAMLPISDVGEYTIVALLNPSPENYEVTGSETLTTFRTELKPDRLDTVARRPSDLFYAHRNIVHVETTEIEYDTVYFHKSTVHFNVHVQLEDHTLPAENTLKVSIDGNNGIFDYLNAKSARRLYLPYTDPQIITRAIQEEHIYQFETMDFHTTDVLNLYVQEVGPTTDRSRSIDIVEALSQVTSENGFHPYDADEKLAQEDEYDLVVVLDAGFKILELRINDWYTIKGDLEL